MTELPRLKELRTTLKLSQEKFAEKIGLKQQQYSRYEKGDNEIPIEYIKRVCTIYKVSANWLLEINLETEEVE